MSSALRSLPLLALFALACRTEDKDRVDTADVHSGNPGSDSGALIDEDADGYASAEDCDDSNAAINPGALELCDGLDNNCEGNVDEDASDASTWYLDTDGDGYGLDQAELLSCDAPEGYASQAGDCDDTDPAYYPGAGEDDCADPNDYNCDGSSGFADNDGDGYAACEECDDSASTTNPGAYELCDGSDNDCDGSTDEDDAKDAQTWYQDGDADGYGDKDFTTEACDQPEGYSDNKDDCDDKDGDVHPDAEELCDEADNDCDGAVDDNPTDTVTWYIDYDSDGYGDTRYTLDSCDQPSGYASQAGDCKDTNSAINPGAKESCNGTDDNCDGSKDEGDPEGPDEYMTYADADGDGYGDSSDPGSDHCQTPSGETTDNTDCDDSDNTVNPGASEVWYDGVDSDCAGDSDYDQDGDGADSYAELSTGTDCLDTDASVIGCGLTQATAGATCLTLYTNDPTLKDGVYWLDPDDDGDTSDAWQGYCDMTRDGGGWTLVLNNVKSVYAASTLTWSAAINKVTVRGGTLGSSLSAFDLWVGLAEWGDIGTYARIETGSTVGTPSNQAFYTLTLNASANYTLNLTGGTVKLGSTPGIDSYHNGRAFTTYDSDNDAWSSNCATYYGHPWWYGACWSGSFWGGTAHQEAAYWTSSTSDYYAWGAIWLQ